MSFFWMCEVFQIVDVLSFSDNQTIREKYLTVVKSTLRAEATFSRCELTCEK